MILNTVEAPIIFKQPLQGFLKLIVSLSWSLTKVVTGHFVKIDLPF